MCIAKSPKIDPPRPPVDRESVAAQASYNRVRAARMRAYDESDTNVVGKLAGVATRQAPQTQLKQLMGA